MIILIGGVPRSGKTMLAHKLFDARRIPIIHLDIFREMFEHAMRGLDIANGNDPDDNAERMWKFVKAFIMESVAQNESYIIEGSDMLPRLVSKLLPNQDIAAVFLGYALADSATKVAAIRKYPDRQEWTTKMSDTALYEFVEDNIQRSRLTMRQCEQTDIPYIETSHHFTDAIDHALRLLAESMEGKSTTY